MKSCPTESRIEHVRGLVLTLLLFVSLRVGEIVLNAMAGIGLTLTTPREVAISCGLDMLLFCFVLVSMKEVGKIAVGNLFWQRLPRLGEGVRWGLAGVFLSVPGFFKDLELPTYFGHEGYVIFALLEAARATVLIPLLEETLFRGICFGSLARIIHA